MSNKLRKKDHTFDFVKVRATKEDKEDKAIMCLSNHMQYMIYLALLDVCGFKEKRIRKFYAAMKALKESWVDGKAPTDEMLVYCRKKKIPAYEWMKAIPVSKKLALIKPYTCVNVVNFAEAAILVHVMMTAIILKEEFRISNSQIGQVLKKVESDMDCYIAVQPRSKKPYLTDESILQIFREELRLDLVTGEKVA